nr:hypothetical protein [Pseudorhizobium banfieldiae]
MMLRTPADTGTDNFAAFGIDGDELNAVLLEYDAQLITHLGGQRLLSEFEVAERLLRYAGPPRQLKLGPTEQGSACPYQISRQQGCHEDLEPAAV